MVRACLGTADAPAELNAFVVEHSDGLPFLIEELLAGVVASGALVYRDGRVADRAATYPGVPSSLAGSVRSRLRAFDRTRWRVFAAAARAGPPVRLAPAARGRRGRRRAAVVDVLRQAVERPARHRGGPAVPVPARADPRGRARRAAASGAGRAVRARAGRDRSGRIPGCPVRGASWPPSSPRPPATRTRASGLLDRERPAGPGPGCAVHRGADRRTCPAAGPGRVGGRRRTPTRCWCTTLAHAGKPRPARAIGHASAGPVRRAVECRPARRIDLLLVLARAALAAGDASAAAGASVEQARQLRATSTDVGVGAPVGRGRRPRRVGPGAGWTTPAGSPRPRPTGPAAAGFPRSSARRWRCWAGWRERAADRVALFRAGRRCGRTARVDDLAAARPARAGSHRGRAPAESSRCARSAG